jgi:hypothetical protein
MFDTTHRCDFFCNAEPVVSIYCEHSAGVPRWAGEPEKGLWCYRRPDQPEPQRPSPVVFRDGFSTSSDEFREVKVAKSIPNGRAVLPLMPWGWQPVFLG